MPDDDDDDVPETFCPTAEDFNNAMARTIHEILARAEKEAAETGKTVETGFEAVQDTPGSGKEAIIHMRWVCEPGKPARRVA